MLGYFGDNIMAEVAKALPDERRRVSTKKLHEESGAYEWQSLN